MANIVFIKRAALLAVILIGGAAARAQEEGLTQRLVASYPGIVTAVKDNAVIFADGSTLPLDDGGGQKPFQAWLDHPDIEDMFAEPYVRGPLASPPGPEDDPGRARNEAFFKKVYGECRKGGLRGDLVNVPWLPSKTQQTVQVTSRNGVSRRIAAVSAELDKLPAKFDRYLKTKASAYNCRTIAGSNRMSGHAFGIAIDIAVTPSSYWRWQKGDVAQTKDHTGDLPLEIVQIFEKHGFIWGGKWRHFDTMHFEYRPELVAPEALGNPAADVPSVKQSQSQVPRTRDP